MDNRNCIQTTEQFLQALKYEIKNNEIYGESDEQKSFEHISEEKSKIMKNKMDEKNQSSHRKLSKKYDELICKLKNSKNNSNYLQKEVCKLQNDKVSIIYTKKSNGTLWEEINL